MIYIKDKAEFLKAYNEHLAGIVFWNDHETLPNKVRIQIAHHPKYAKQVLEQIKD